MGKKINDETLGLIRSSSANYGGTRWAAYRNEAMDSASFGHLQFLAVGPKNSYLNPPKHYPDSKMGAGWKYRFVGFLDKDTGEIQEEEK